MKNESFETLVWKEGCYYVAQCLSVDVSSFGTTRNAALNNLREALELYFEDAPKKRSSVERVTLKATVLAHA